MVVGFGGKAQGSGSVQGFAGQFRVLRVMSRKATQLIELTRQQEDCTNRVLARFCDLFSTLGATLPLISPKPVNP